MKILIIGSGGREHAIIRKLALDGKRRFDQTGIPMPDLYAAKGNPGMASLAKCVPIADDDVEGLLRFAKEEAMDLTIVGPEVPLSLGIVDAFLDAGLTIFGPNREAAQLESSKAYAKKFMQQAGIPTPSYAEFTDMTEALTYLEAQSLPIVIKADGLAAGKGVTVAYTKEEAIRAVKEAMQDRVFGDAGSRLIIEAFVNGPELSVMAFVDQSGFKMMPAIQDHKQVYDDDLGPNTGGMGTFYPVPIATANVIHQVRTEIFERFVAHLAASGIVFRGVLFAGIIVQAGKPYVIEFNVRFGDPETQVVMELLEADILSIFESVTKDQIAQTSIMWSNQPTVCVIIASKGYPGAYRKGYPIEGLATLSQKAYAIHAGTAFDEQGRIVTAGGRVLGVVSRASTLNQARQQAYQAIDSLSFEGMHMRRDIGTRKSNLNV